MAVLQAAAGVSWQPPPGLSGKCPRCAERSGTYLARYMCRHSGTVLSGHFIFRTFEGDRLVREDRDGLKMYFYTYHQMLTLFRLVGFEIVEQYGSFAKTPLDESASDMNFVLKPANTV